MSFNKITNKILYGVSDVQLVDDRGNIYKIDGAMSVEVEFEQEETYAKKNGHDSVRFTGPLRGRGKLHVLNLTLQEQSLMFGYEYSNGEMIVPSNPIAPDLKMMFSREKANGRKINTVLYRTIFKTPSISANTLASQMNEDTLSIDFDVLVCPKTKLMYYSIDTEDRSLNADVKNKFFLEVQYPKKVGEINAKR